MKSQSAASMLRALTLNLSIAGNGNIKGTIPNIFNSISLKVGDTVIGNGTIGTVSGAAGGYQSAPVTFNNFSANLPADAYTDVSVLARVSQSATDDFEGMLASTTLDLTSASNIDVEDNSFVRIAPKSILLAGNIQEFTTSNVSLAGLPTVTYGSIASNTKTGSSTQQFVFTLPLLAGKNAIYIGKSAYVSIGTSTNPAGFAIKSVDFSDSDTSGDGSTYFYIAPGQAKTFTATYSASGLSSSAGSLQMAYLQYGTDSSAAGGFLVSPDVSNILTATLFH